MDRALGWAEAITPARRTNTCSAYMYPSICSRPCQALNLKLEAMVVLDLYSGYLP